jgi:acetolactate synthase-1/2/3 large subunit
VPDSFARAYGVMMTEPRGPIYMCYDAWLQEQPLDRDVPLPPGGSARTPTRIAPEPTALLEVADRLTRAQRPVIIAEYVGREPEGFHALVDLAEAAGIPVYDVDSRLNFPSRHPLNVSDAKDVFRTADLILSLDTRDWERPTTELVSATREVRSLVPPDAAWIDIGFGDLELSSWALDYQRLRHAEMRILADTTLAIPALAALIKARAAEDAGLRERIAARSAATAALTAGVRDQWMRDARSNWDANPISLPRLASDVWAAIKDEDWVLSAGTLEQWARKLWDFDRPYRHPGRSLGTATQFGISIGVALAHRDHKRLVVDLQPDGDLMYDAGALWTVAKHRIPMLVVMYNNRAYYNDWEHQIRMARLRGTPVERAHIGMDMDDPAPDFAAMARSMGWYAEGPFVSPDDLPAALTRAIAEVKAGRPALLDTVTQKR